MECAINSFAHSPGRKTTEIEFFLKVRTRKTNKKTTNMIT